MDIHDQDGRLSTPSDGQPLMGVWIAILPKLKLGAVEAKRPVAIGEMAGRAIQCQTYVKPWNQGLPEHDFFTQ